MPKYYYKKEKKQNKRKFLRLLSLGFLITGIVIIIYVFFPLISWQLYFAPVFASQNITVPIPKNNIVTGGSLQSLITQASNSLSGVDYTNADNWFPNFKYQKLESPKIQSYTLSIPKLKIENAEVTTVDNDLAKHLVNYGGTAFPSNKGNAVIFGHSTLPQLYEKNNYRTIFTFLYKLTPGDKILVKIGDKTYTYKVQTITVVDPENTSILEQNFDDSYLTLVTCTPPGTIWKRLVVKSKIVRS